MADKNRRKQIKKRIDGLKKQKKRHLEKIEMLQGRKDTTKDYWEKEVGRMNGEIEKLESELEE
jgi:hypothetical protein